MKTTSKKTGAVEFLDYKKIEPEDLTTFSKEYKEHIPLLKKYITENRKKICEVKLMRITENGSLKERIILGAIGSISENNFEFYSNIDINGTYYEDSHKILIRLDNVLGIIPMLPSVTIYPFENDSSKATRNYFRALKKMTDLMKQSVGIKHSAFLFYRYDKKNPTLRNGNYQVECEITKVNKSNVEYQHYRTFSFVDKENSYVDIVPRDNEVDRFIAPDRYLQKVQIFFGTSPKINPHDDQ